MNVSERFDAFLANIALTPVQLADGTKKQAGVRSTLNRNYYGNSSEIENSLLVGSWGKDTKVRPPRDIDILFILPYGVYRRFEPRVGNKQAQLLREVKDVLLQTYPNTTMRADGQAVVVSFGSDAVDVVPAFLLDNKQYWICDTNAGGKYKTIDPIAEIANVHDSDTATNRNTRKLVRMMKTWQHVCSVPIKSSILELLVIEFLSGYAYKTHSSMFYDRMVRDFFAFLLMKDSRSHVWVPGTSELVWLNADDWHTLAKTAHDRAVTAASDEVQHMPFFAGGEWQKIFGDDIPA